MKVVSCIGALLLGAGCRGGSDTHADVPTSNDTPKASAPETFDAFGDPLGPGVIARFGTHRLAARAGTIESLALSPDGRFVSIARKGRPEEGGPRSSVCVHEVPSGRLVYCRDGVLATALVFDHAAGLYVATANAPIARWPVRDGKDMELDGGRGAAALVVSPDGKYLLVHEGASVTQFDTGSPQASWSLDFHIAAIGYDTRGPLGVRSAPDAPVEVVRLDATTGVPLGAVALEGVGSVDAQVRLSPDGKLVAVPDGRQVDVFDTGTGRRVASLPTPDGSREVAFTTDGRLVAARSGSAQEGLRAWDTATRHEPLSGPARPFARFLAWDTATWTSVDAPWTDTGDMPRALVAGADGRLAWVTGLPGRVHVASRDGTRDPAIPTFQTVRVSGEGDKAVVLALVDGHPEVMDPRRGTRQRLQLPASVGLLGGEPVIGNRDSTRIAGLVVGDEAAFVGIWRAADGSLEHTWQLPFSLMVRDSHETCRDLAWTNDETVGVLAGDRALFINANDGKVRSRHALPANDGCMWAAAGSRVVLRRLEMFESFDVADGTGKTLGPMTGSLSPAGRTWLAPSRVCIEQWDVATATRARCDAHIDPSLQRVPFLPLDTPEFLATQRGLISLATGGLAVTWSSEGFADDAFMVSPGDQYLVRHAETAIEVLELKRHLATAETR